jgi:hypothetical protein
MTVLSPNGRWGGAATQRPLPEADAELEGMDPAQRDLLAQMWWSQAATERRVASSFRVVHKALVHLEADAGLIQIAERAVDDEFRHAALCRTTASRYLGHALPAQVALPFTHPTHPEANSERTRQALYVVGQCVFNETFASAYLSASLDRATHPLARAALRELLADEVDHARIGWAYLASMAEDLRAEVADWLVPLAKGNLGVWRALSLPPACSEIVGHGVPSAALVEESLVSVLRTLIVPGVQAAGLTNRKFVAWAEAGAVTAA